MATTTQLEHLNIAGIALLATTILFMIGAFAAAYFRKMPLPQTPLEQLTAIAGDRIGWTAQAIIFPVAYLATALIFGYIGAQLQGPESRWLAIGATILCVAGCLLWLPISLHRLELGANAAELLRTFDPNTPVEVGRNTWVFWPHTLCFLAAIALVGAALALAGVLPMLGWIVAALATVSMVLGPLVMHDWPPFMSYVILLVMALGLMRAS